MNGRPALSGVRGRQISVFLDDKPGTLGRLLRLLGDEGINVLALSLAEGIDHGYVRLVADRPDDANALLRGNGYLLYEKEVLLLEVANRPGALAAVARLWGDLGINIEYAYCAAGPGVASGLIVVRVDDTARALEALA